MNYNYSNNERRKSQRKNNNNDVVIRWIHDERTPIIYKTADLSDEGISLFTSAPLNNGLSGLIEKFVNSKNLINKAAIVVWCIKNKSESNNANLYRVGLRFVESK